MCLAQCGLALAQPVFAQAQGFSGLQHAQTYPDFVGEIAEQRHFIMGERSLVVGDQIQHAEGLARKDQRQRHHRPHPMFGRERRASGIADDDGLA